MLSMFVLMLTFGTNLWVAALSAILFGLCTNHFILFEAGHSSKIMTVFTAPLMIAGMVLLHKKSYLGGAALFTPGCRPQPVRQPPSDDLLSGNGACFYVAIEMIQSACKAEWVHIGKLMAIYLVGSALALGASWSKISATIDYTKDTMRGTPILTTKGDGGEAKKGRTGIRLRYGLEQQQR